MDSPSVPNLLFVRSKVFEGWRTRTSDGIIGKLLNRSRLGKGTRQELQTPGNPRSNRWTEEGQTLKSEKGRLIRSILVVLTKGKKKKKGGSTNEKVDMVRNEKPEDVGIVCSGKKEKKT